MKFDAKDIKFNNAEVLVGPEFGDLHAEREIYVEQNRHNMIVEPVIPQNIRVTKII